MKFLAILQAVLGVLLQIFEAVLSFILTTVSLFSKEDHRHKASFGDGEFLSRWNKGFNVNGEKLTIEMSQRGLLVSGETGSGKTSGQFLKSCLFVEGSQIIHAPNFDIFNETSGYRSQSDHIKVFSPARSEYSLGFNPMLRCTTLAQLNRLAFLLVSLFSSEKEQGSFWNNRAQEILTTLMARLKKSDIPKEYQTLPNVCLLLDLMSSEKSRPYVDSLFMDLGKEDEWLYQKYESICSQSDNVFQGAISSAQSATSMFDLDNDIKSLVSHDELGDFDTLRKERSTFYLVSSTTKGSYYGPLLTILMDQFMESFFSRIPNADEEQVFFHIDEAPLIRLDWDIICANVRKHKGSICLLAQDPYSQFKAIYGESKTNAILSNLKTKVYFSLNYDTALRLEKELGIYSYEDEYDEQKMKTRSLRTASELMQIPENQVLITHSGHQPFLTEFTPYYLDSTCVKATETPPYTIANNYHTKVAFLPIKDMYPNSEDYEV